MALIILIVVLAITAIFGTVVTFIKLSDAKNQSIAARSSSKPDPELRRAGTDMARFLESSANDPMNRVSNEWTEEARRLADNWYGK